MLKCSQIVAKIRSKDKRKTPKLLIISNLGVFAVVPPGIEPGTQGFSEL